MELDQWARRAVRAMLVRCARQAADALHAEVMRLAAANARIKRWHP